MTQARSQEIRAIHDRHQDFYRIGGGLFVILVLILIGSWAFGENQLGFAEKMLGYATNVATEALSVIATIVVINQLNHRRDRDERKDILFEQAKSRSNDMAVDAVEKIQRAGWFDEMLEYYRSTVTFLAANVESIGRNSIEDDIVDLSKVRWGGGISLKHVNLQRADLRQANLASAEFLGSNLQGAYLTSADLRGAAFLGVDLQGADLRFANLKGAKFVEADLKGANLLRADLRHAIMFRAEFDTKTILPDAMTIPNIDGQVIFDKYWTPDTDMERYTKPEHPDFWEAPKRI